MDCLERRQTLLCHVFLNRSYMANCPGWSKSTLPALIGCWMRWPLESLLCSLPCLFLCTSTNFWWIIAVLLTFHYYSFYKETFKDSPFNFIADLKAADYFRPFPEDVFKRRRWLGWSPACGSSGCLWRFWTTDAISRSRRKPVCKKSMQETAYRWFLLQAVISEKIMLISII